VETRQTSPVVEADGRGPAALGAAIPASTHETVISSRRSWAPFELTEIWQHRELLYLLIWRNVKVRYKQTALGAAWAVIPAVMTMVIFTLIFGGLVGVSSDGSPYALFSFAAVVPWMYFSASVTQASVSLVENTSLFTKVYFPRLLLPLSVVIAALLDFVIAFALLIVLIFAFGAYPSVDLFAAPALALLLTTAVLGVGLWLAAFNVFYRDVRFASQFLVQFWLFASPVAYSTSVIPETWRLLYALNPMVGVIDGFRWAVLDTVPFPGPYFLVSVSSAVALLVGGLLYFRHVEDSFADVV
jgi:lipopolysaccharide transport system permease protein